MEITTVAKNIRISSRKLKPIVLSVKKLKPQESLSALAFIKKSGAKPLAKVIASAIANATHNFGLRADDLQFKTIEIGKGKTLKRYRAAAKGRVRQISKRTTNIKIILKGESKAKGQELKEVKEDMKKTEDLQNK